MPSVSASLDCTKNKRSSNPACSLSCASTPASTPAPIELTGSGSDAEIDTGSGVEGPGVEGPGVEGPGVEDPGVEGPGVEE